SAVEGGDKSAAEAELREATKTLEMAATKGVYHKNNVANKTSKMAKAVNKMA
ncbi:MAG: 30S ribosomal protein S20, partial [Lachnospiraceae bacterium]|nr:30S ribosomal protein S20 [Lachnospiraceae bacterium]